MNEIADAAAHRKLRELLGAYALDQLGQHERLAVDAHLTGCASCRAELEDLVPAAGALRLADPDHLPGSGRSTPDAPPPELEDSVLARIQRERRTRRFGDGRKLAVAAAVVVALAVGAVVGWWVTPGAPDVPLEPVAVSATGSIEADADLVAHTWGVEIKLTATGFDPGSRYRVSVIGRDGRDHAAGQFIGTGAAEMKCNLNSSVLRADATGFRVTDADGTTLVRSSF